MNERQKRFADEYIRTANKYQSAVRAGYSEKYAKTNAHKLLENTSVKNYVEARFEELKKQAIAEQDEVLQFLTSVMRGEEVDEENIVVPKGDFLSDVEKHTKRADTAQRIKSAELLGKRYAIFTDKQEITQRNIELNIGAYDDDDSDD
ncbi:terminase small subunit [Staphylococcus sp. 18_1_E_LY]|uniref:Terminase small subunit n=1 Tax=Staphylococcus lloydii TaxID=2781774 RepID=A0A7T1F9I9_9STAP|nr:terminase small subunit [Staphylococcus lloydii]MBF7019632.1 terminase small subunit [Staphylococcus lloydii]MBF7027360.1 terminase small subunit [Staphylococcus lloydii]MDU9419006.1 terminase small subunit [Staphylococcus lloydii]QPM75023.1 terminase small subunit [Staphylococcus lloydii]